MTIGIREHRNDERDRKASIMTGVTRGRHNDAGAK
jgi:hypothetical protein